ncbi:Integrase core domain-containing protein [Propionibacterium cyclohexanicum]|uniref:Integrase core domain-containing protein n=1 Tax=Propionibacterium cyclohexanicum TaxID=64702 RepID=A0A1H9TMC6_9ACTN|nr:Integrase core domain-containing protein [Propionibacterium cyclohexanicum]
MISFIGAHRDEFGVEPICGELPIAPQTYYAAKDEAGARDRPADLVEREFTASAPNRLWVADITYIRTFTGWVDASFVIDVFSRRVVGWQLSTSLHTDLALDALKRGLWSRTRGGRDVSALIHHSDRGVQYRAIRYTQRLADAGESRPSEAGAIAMTMLSRRRSPRSSRRS